MSRESASLDYDIPYSPEAWRGRIRGSAGIAASLGAALAFCHLDREAPALQGAPRQLIESLYAKLREGV